MRSHALFALLVLAGCSSSSSAPPDAAAPTDGNASVLDANPPLDGAGAVMDAGPFSPHPRLRALADDTALELGPFECTSPGPDDGVCSRVTDYSGLTYDTTHHRFLMFGGGHSTTMTDSIFAFDLDDTLTWKELYAPTPCELMVAKNLDPDTGAWKAGPSGPYPRPLSIHSYDLLAWAPVERELVLLSRMFSGGYCNTVGNDVGGPIAHWEDDKRRWTFSAVAGVSNVSIDASEFDPPSGKIVILGGSGLSLYDPATRTRAAYVETFNGETLKTSDGQDADFSALSYANDLVYYPPTDTHYYFVRGAPVQAYALRLDRQDPRRSTLDHVVTAGPTSDLEEPGYAYDSHNKVIGGAVSNSTFYAFDPATKTWSAHPIKGGTPGDLASLAIGYDPVNNVFIFRTDYTSGSSTWAFRLKN